MSGFLSCLQIFPTSDIRKTTQFYEQIGFRSVAYLQSSEPHVCLYRDGIEIILTQSTQATNRPNRELHGYGYDAYFIAHEGQLAILERELISSGVQIVRPLSRTDYGNREFVFEDVDGRWIAVGIKQN